MGLDIDATRVAGGKRQERIKADAWINWIRK